MKLSEKLKDRESEIIIYGASVYGELAFRGLEKLGLKPAFFIDRSFKKRQHYFGVPVLKPKDVERHRESVLLIASADFYYEIFNFLESMDCINIYDISYLLNLDLPEKKLSARALEMYHAKENYFSAARATELTIIHLGLCVTEKCSLKCKDCSFLMQYYSKPENIDLEYYKPALDRLIENVDYISELRMYGGEPFINRDMYKVIEWYKECSKIGVLSIYTNGTIIPDEVTLKSLENKKVKVHISDYTHNMDRAKKLIRVLKERGIDYFIRRYDEWQKAGDLMFRSYSYDQCKSIYERCFATNCYSFLRGKFYVCPRAAHAANLQAVENVDRDYIDFNDSTTTKEELQKKLFKLMHHTDFIHACRYCDGLDNHVSGVTPAIQIKYPLEYKKL